MNKIAVIIGVMMIAVALGIALFSLLHSSPAATKKTDRNTSRGIRRYN